eukprot:12881304-Prorocentrum_lima.AAC.1
MRALCLMLGTRLSGGHAVSCTELLHRALSDVHESGTAEGVVVHEVGGVMHGREKRCDARHF